MARPRGRPRKMPFEERWDALLDAACEVFADRGLASGSIGEIAERAGITRALVYEHVKSKNDLFAAAVVREREELVQYVAIRYEATAGLPLRARVRDRYHVLLDFSEERPVGVRLLALPEASMVLHEAGRTSAPDDLADQLASEFEAAGMPHRRVPEILSTMIIGMVNEIVAVRGDHTWDTEAVVDLLTDFTLAGIAGLDPELLERAD